MRKIVLFITAISFLTCGCTRYEAEPLVALRSEFMQTTKKCPGVEVGCKALTKEETLKYLSKYNKYDKWRSKLDNVNLQLDIVNQSDQTYVYSRTNVSLNTMSPDEYVAAIEEQIGMPSYNWAASASTYLILAPILVPGMLVEATRADVAKSKFKKDYMTKLIDQVDLPPQTRCSMILLVPRDEYSPLFKLTLVNQETGKEKTFDIQVHDK